MFVENYFGGFFCAYQMTLAEALLWIMDIYFSWKQLFEVRNILMMDLFLTNMQLFASQDANWWTGAVWIIVMFLSAVLTLILTAPIHGSVNGFLLYHLYYHSGYKYIFS